MPASNRLVCMVTSALAVVPSGALAAQFDYSLWGGFEHSNNINLSSENPISEDILIPGVNFTYAEQGSTLKANVIGAVEYHDYLGGHFDNQTQTQLAGQANWTLLPERLDFFVEDDAAVQPVDSLASDSPDNQQQTNVISAGPTLHLRFGEAMHGQVELRYINSYASKVDDFNSSRGAAAVRLFRDINPTDQLSANIETQHVNFNNSGAPNYDRNEAFIGYNSELARFDINTLLGWSQLKFDHAPSESNPLFRLTVDWRPSQRSTFSLAGAYQYSDAALDMLPSQRPALNQTTAGINTGDTVIDSQVYQERSLQGTYAFRSERLTFSASPIYRKLNYFNDYTFNQTGRGGSVSLDYRIHPDLSLSAMVNSERLTYDTLNRRDNTLRFGLDLSRQWNTHWSAHISVERQRRNSDVASQSYRETRIFFGVVYRR